MRPTTDKTEIRKTTETGGADRARRRLLQGLTVGGAVVTAGSLPERWTRPLVEAVMLPVHAQTSPAPSDGILTGDDMFEVDDLVGLEQPANNVASAQPGRVILTPAPDRGSSLLDFFIGPAQATIGGQIIAEAALEPDGTCTVNFSMNGFVFCEPPPATPEEFEVDICVTGQFSSIEVGQMTSLSDSCSNSYPAEILAEGDESIVLGVVFEGEERQITLNPGGSVPSCSGCIPFPEGLCIPA